MPSFDVESLFRMLYGQQGVAESADVPQVLESKDIPGLAKYINSDACTNVFVMLGAGVSTSAGIPDFRSPDTGLYANLARLNLPYPEAVFNIRFFKENPHPFYALAKELYPGKYRPTISHSFVKLLADKSLLRRCFTQNIDTLERRAGIPGNKIIEAHGSFATHRCIECKAPFDDESMKKAIDTSTIPHCTECDGLVKPNIVFFGESLPESFHHALPGLSSADLLIVMGTSLVVHPFASLVDMVPSGCPRVLINMEPAGDIGENKNDVLLLGKCDEIVQQLSEALGWKEELANAWASTVDAVDVQEEQEVVRASASKQDLQDEVDKLAEEVASVLTTGDKPEVEQLPGRERTNSIRAQPGSKKEDIDDKADADTHDASYVSTDKASGKAAQAGEDEKL